VCSGDLARLAARLISQSDYLTEHLALMEPAEWAEPDDVGPVMGPTGSPVRWRRYEMWNAGESVLRRYVGSDQASG
jgi:hypothetical protein